MLNHRKELLIIVSIIIVSYFFLSIVATGILFVFSDTSVSPLAALMENRVLMLSLNSLSMLMFISPFFYVKKLNNYSTNLFEIYSIPLVLIILSTLSFMVINSEVIEWNKSIVFPEFMSGFETWAYNKEKELEKITIFLVSFENNWQYLFGILTIAIIPGICEEYLFRGVLQRNFYLISKNIHLSILISAFLFSALHLQFYGFFPRMLLGILFGYIFFWSGSLIYPIIGHVFNNFFSLSIFYFSQNGYMGDDLSLSVNSSPDIPFLVTFIVFFIFLFCLYSFKKYFNEDRE
tara:strand:+ start:770 stop:1642 length:873 start_codon:yes stop_codon:yes gene_type:complete